MLYSNNPKYRDRQAWANIVDPDQMPQNAASDQGLHYLPLIQHYIRHCYHIALVKALFSIQKVLIFFLFLHENIHYGYSLEVSHQHVFVEKQEKY